VYLGWGIFSREISLSAIANGGDSATEGADEQWRRGAHG